MKTQGLLLDVDYITGENKQSVIRLFIKTGRGIEIFHDPSFRPYLYVITKGDAKKVGESILKQELGKEKVKATGFEELKKDNAEGVLKIYFSSTLDLSAAREELESIPGVVEKREYDIAYSKRYLIDSGLVATGPVEVEYEEVDGKKLISKAANIEKGSTPKLKLAAFDLETDISHGFSNPERDPILMASYADEDGETVMTYDDRFSKIKGVEVFKDEGEMIGKLAEKIGKKNVDVVVSYNGDNFDLPYLKERARQLKVRFGVGVDGSGPVLRKQAMGSSARIRGRQHLDAYRIARFLGLLGVLNLTSYDLETVYNKMFGTNKEKVSAEDMHRIWKTGKDLERLVEYNREDSIAAYRIAKEHFQLYAELSRLVRQPVYEASRTSTGMLVEDLLINRSFEKNLLIPNRPNEGEVKQRMLQTWEGGYVKEPKPGLHENIAVLDFRSLYPTVMISHNISPETLDCDCCKNKPEHLAPNKHWYCSRKKGLLSGILEEVLNRRMEIQKEMRKQEKDSPEYRALYAKQYALKIILNSSYGYLGYARSRWYSRESAAAITGWSRHYIKQTNQMAEEEGFVPLYTDTDSSFLILPKGKTEKDVLSFVDKLNKKLPGILETEFEGLFRRGIFVTKKEGGAAKKRYALIDFEGNLKIVGFEYVRRDWSKIAKETQKRVIKAVLEEGKPDEAVRIVRKTIEELKEGKVAKEKLVIFTQIQKPLSQYVAIGPHIAAAKKAVAKGKKLGVGSMIGYVITRKGKSISDRAELEEYVGEEEYDPDYYIENQLIPAVIKIIREFGHEKEDLIHGGKQQTLGAFS